MKSPTLEHIVAAKMKAIAPDIYAECEELMNAPLTDLRLLPAVLNEAFHRFEPNPENSPFILGIIYSLYAPYKLHYPSIRLHINIRQTLCEAFNWADRPIVNYYGGILQAYYKGARWKAMVHLNANEILKIVNDNKAEILEALKKNSYGN